MKKKKRISDGIILLILSFACSVQLCSCCFASDNSLIAEDFPIYYGTLDNEDTIRLYFADENRDIPYLDTGTAKNLLEKFYHDINGDQEYSLTLEKEGPVVTFTRENQSAMVFDADQDKIHFDNYDAFSMPSWSDTIIDVLEHYGTINCLQSDEEQSYSRCGSEVDIDLAEYNIDIIESGGECYIPMQTFSDIAASVTCYVNLVYNHQAVFAIEYSISESQDTAGFIEKLYEVPTGMRSRTLADFTYNEFCMVLDYFYGLKKQQNIDKFDNYLVENGLKNSMISEDPTESVQAVYDLLEVQIGDMHSALVSPSYLVGSDHRVHTAFSQALYDSVIASGRISGAQYDRYPDGIPGYEEIGNTAFISFVTFKPLEDGRDYYTDPPTADTSDTVGLCLYAFSQITRDGSPVENVVLDLSCNAGGDTTTASFVLAMFLGEASICVEDTLTGAYANASFLADANLDGEFYNREDTLTDYNLYCLTSPQSFSCANLVASVFKNTRLVTIIGQHTAGGSCIVMPLSLADGTLVQISGCRSYSYMMNGSVHDIDEGVEPDIYIVKPASFFDREALSEFINSTL